MRSGTFALALTLSAVAHLQSEERPDLTADEIVARAIEAHAQHNDDDGRPRYDYAMLSITEKLDGDGEVVEIEKERYETRVIEGEVFERLVEKDGRELTEDELEDEDEREREFRDRLRKGETDEDEGNERVDFDEELVSRYDIVLESTEELDGLECYVLSFSPKPGKLPKRRRMDVVLNKARGRFWVDRDAFQIARIEFVLDEKVKLWWGILGSVSNMTGELQRRPVDERTWLPERFQFYMRGRVLFRSLHLRQEVLWNDVRRRKPALATDSQAEQGR